MFAVPSASFGRTTLCKIHTSQIHTGQILVIFSGIWHIIHSPNITEMLAKKYTPNRSIH